MGYLGGRARTAALAAAAAAAALCAAAPASALDWGETASRAVPGGGPASCLRDAGGGLLSMLGPLGERTTAFDLIAPSDHRLAPAGRAKLGILDVCPAVAA